MIRIGEYLINKNEILYVEKYAFTWLSIRFKNGEILRIELYEEEKRDEEFENICLRERS